MGKVGAFFLKNHEFYWKKFPAQRTSCKEKKETGKGKKGEMRRDLPTHTKEARLGRASMLAYR